jgi:predicted NAD/FAD-binding protein
LKIAIIGSGIAGLASAYLLRNHECEVFEAKPFMSLAGHGMKLENGKVIDIPLRVIHPQYYPNLLSLCKELGIGLRKLEHSGSFSLSQAPESFEYFSIPIFKKRYNCIKPTWGHIKIGAEFLSFYHLCHKYKNDERYEEVSFGEFLEQKKISSKLTQMILYPLLSSICTCSYEELDAFPARVLLEMMSMIAGPVPMERFYAGTHDIENALTQQLDKIHLSSKVEKITIKDKSAELLINGETKVYDHIVIATEAHFVKDILEENDHTVAVLKELATIPYKCTDTVIHTVDESHEQVRGQKSLHYLEYPQGGEAQASMWLNKVEPRLDLKEQTMQTWNPYEDKVENELKRSTLNRALMTVESYQAVKRLQNFSHPAFSLAGSYLAHGVPLLEGGVESAIHITKSLSN